jgi:hypothetical protein
MKNIKTQGFILIDVDVVALKNAGKTHKAILIMPLQQKPFARMEEIMYMYLDKLGVIGGVIHYKKYMVGIYRLLYVIIKLLLQKLIL